MVFNCPLRIRCVKKGCTIQKDFLLVVEDEKLLMKRKQKSRQREEKEKLILLHVVVDDVDMEMGCMLLRKMTIKVCETHVVDSMPKNNA
jgi:hypothetical protein